MSLDPKAIQINTNTLIAKLESEYRQRHCQVN